MMRATRKQHPTPSPLLRALAGSGSKAVGNLLHFFDLNRFLVQQCGELTNLSPIVTEIHCEWVTLVTW
jgi:hypothetical protein